ncbi:hypothetical protein K458DRAFT_208316 [Lentithecium fluviatile CBS 122367]|uniref:Uncharacterized protein n=1 Tax=Lentithecium fluviatile CBS 122367 TaxID=1168545 RepID=A0A6G1J6C6_9PLEO|nr:hypothetical protein K458DRAFT_208316 [Lentithecium fluviatile CBS 122367]
MHRTARELSRFFTGIQSRVIQRRWPWIRFTSRPESRGRGLCLSTCINGSLFLVIKLLSIFLDGVPVLEFDEANPTPLVYYLALAHHQLVVEKWPTLHFPDMPPHVAWVILDFTQTAPVSLPPDVGVPAIPLSGRLLEDIDMYTCLLRVGMRPAVLLSTAAGVCAKFAQEWSTLIRNVILELDRLFNAFEELLNWHVPTFAPGPCLYDDRAHRCIPHTREAVPILSADKTNFAPLRDVSGGGDSCRPRSIRHPGPRRIANYSSTSGTTSEFCKEQGAASPILR